MWLMAIGRQSGVAVIVACVADGYRVSVLSGDDRHLCGCVSVCVVGVIVACAAAWLTLIFVCRRQIPLVIYLNLNTFLYYLYTSSI